MATESKTHGVDLPDYFIGVKTFCGRDCFPLGGVDTFRRRIVCEATVLGVSDTILVTKDLSKVTCGACRRSGSFKNVSLRI